MISDRLRWDNENATKDQLRISAAMWAAVSAAHGAKEIRKTHANEHAENAEENAAEAQECSNGG